MAYNGKTNWQNNEIVEAVDMNRIEQGISDADVGLGNVQSEVTAHKADSMPHKFVDGVTTYRWGFRTLNGQPQFIYEEVVE
jgi:hypothetical protein